MEKEVKDEVKRNEQNGEELEVSLQLIADQLHDLISQTDVNSKYQYVWPSYQQMLDYNREELLWKSAFALQPRYNRPKAGEIGTKQS